MALIGLSLLIATFSFFCYKHLPRSWPFLTWLRREIRNQPSKDGTTQSETHGGETEGESPQIPEDMADLDRRAMPPPPPPPLLNVSTNRHISPSDTPKVPIIASPSSNSTLMVDNNRRSPPPVFPARNSIQRASGGRRLSQNNLGRVLQPPPHSVNSLIPPPQRSPLPNRLPTASASSSLFIPPTHSAIPPKPRKKVLLAPGHSPMDWAQLSSSPNANLRGLPPSSPYLRVPPSELRLHTGRKGKDAWTVFGGKVYNITPYLPYHPGGEPELLRAAGRDGSKLFGEIHPWVNWEGMLEPCLVGIAVVEQETKSKSQLEEMD